MPRGKNCRETSFAAQLPRNYPHHGGNFERGTIALSCGGEAIWEAFWEAIWVRVAASQKLPRESGSIFAARHQDASQGPLGSFSNLLELKCCNSNCNFWSINFNLVIMKYRSSYPAEVRKWNFSPFLSAKGVVKFGVKFWWNFPCYAFQGLGVRGKLSPKFHVNNGVKNGKFHANSLCWGAALMKYSTSHYNYIRSYWRIWVL